MAEAVTLSFFCVALVVCAVADIPVVVALVLGLVGFLAYGRLKGHPWRALADMALGGVRSVSNILIAFLLIGMLTALWRACGTIPFITCYASYAVSPRTMILAAFLLNALLSLLTGTSFGTAATMGVICMTMGVTMGVDPVLMGGAILSGAYVGDRMSPVSTSALLVATITRTTVMGNMGAMLRSAVVPLLASCAVYLVLGLVLVAPESAADAASASSASTDPMVLFSGEFALHWSTLVPAVVMIGLAVCRVDVKLAMLAGVVAAVPVCLMVQGIPMLDVLRFAVLGYEAESPAMAELLDGGGVVSMINVAAIVCVSSTFAGIFDGTGLLDRLKGLVARVNEGSSPFVATLAAAALTSVVACNQTLAIMLTHQLCGDFGRDARQRAVDLEDSAVVVPALVPWSIAGAVPLAAVGAPTMSLLLACYLYLTPLWRAIMSVVRPSNNTLRPGDSNPSPVGAD